MFQITDFATPISYAPVDTQVSVQPEIQAQPIEIDQGANPEPESNINLSNYYVSVISNTPIGQNQESKTVFVDLEIQVSGPDISSKLIKRICLCKESLIKQAAFNDGYMTATATYVEQKEEEQLNQRLLELAGVSHSKNFVKR